jgi:hypothetical protein
MNGRIALDTPRAHAKFFSVSSGRKPPAITIRSFDRAPRTS